MTALAVALHWDRGGPGPQGATFANDACLVFAEARIDDRESLMAALGPSEPAATDAELIARAYIRWGHDCASHLVGDFAFVVWDRQRRSVYAARDPLQMRSLYWAPLEGGLCFAASAAELARLANLTPRLDRLALACWLAGWPDPDRALFANLAMLPAGHWLAADASGIRIENFWDIDPDLRIRYRRVDEYREHLADLLGHCVEDRLRSGPSMIAAQLSGGMDSTTVCALAAAALQRDGRELVALSHSYRDTRECDETERIAETAARLGIRRRFDLPAETHAGRDFRELYPPVFDSPGTVCSPRYIDELALVRDIGAEVLLTGSGGDEMVWGHSLTTTRRLLRGDLGVIAEVVRGARALDLPVLQTLLQLFVRPLLPESVTRLVRRVRDRPARSRLPDWVAAQAVRDLDLEQTLFVPSPVRFDNPALQARYEALRRTSTFNAVRSYAEVARDFGVEVRHPFFDRRLAEFSFAIPDDLWLRDNYPKWLLRKVMDGRLPDSVVWNRHKVTFNRFFGGLIAAQADGIRAILSDTRLQDLGLVDNARLLAAFERVVESGGERLNVDLLYALLTQVWFQRYAERFDL